jgi:TusA-related sulfurtransferase
MRIVDATDKLCPMPMLLMNAELKSMCSGESLELFTTDPNSENDIKTFCKRTKNTLHLSCTLGEGESKYVFVIIKK